LLKRLAVVIGVAALLYRLKLKEKRLPA